MRGRYSGGSLGVGYSAPPSGRTSPYAADHRGRGGPTPLTATARTARRPLCARRSQQVQSNYHRTVADLPIAGRRLLLRLRVRRFRCRARRCPRADFAERSPRLVAAYGRRTHGQRQALEAMAFALGGTAAARLATRRGSPASGASMLRLVRRTPRAPCPTPRVLGVDDWAFRKKASATVPF